jgi:hypothetical protein
MLSGDWGDYFSHTSLLTRDFSKGPSPLGTGPKGAHPGDLSGTATSRWDLPTIYTPQQSSLKHVTVDRGSHRPHSPPSHSRQQLHPKSASPTNSTSTSQAARHAGRGDRAIETTSASPVNVVRDPIDAWKGNHTMVRAKRPIACTWRWGMTYRSGCGCGGEKPM